MAAKDDPGSPEAMTQPIPADLAARLDELEADSSSADAFAELDRLCAEYPEHASLLHERLATALFDRVRVTRPERIGPFAIVDVLGEGGMGTVYLAQQESPVRRRVALKVIKLGMDSAEILARFELERQALALMNHDCIGNVIRLGADGSWD